jgi:hypothetical protein
VDSLLILDRIGSILFRSVQSSGTDYRQSLVDLAEMPSLRGFGPLFLVPSVRYNRQMNIIKVPKKSVRFQWSIRVQTPVRLINVRTPVSTW